MDDIVVERVLRIVELVPTGRVVSYGSVGIVADCSPRYVGRVMKEFGSNVTWWRVVNAAGRLPAELLGRAREKWADEAPITTPTRRSPRVPHPRSTRRAVDRARNRPR